MANSYYKGGGMAQLDRAPG